MDPIAGGYEIVDFDEVSPMACPCGQARRAFRDVPDFPKPGILFYDITTLLKDPGGLLVPDRAARVVAQRLPLQGDAVISPLIGKPRDKSANGMAEEFLKRSSRYMQCEMREIHPRRFDLWAKHPSASKVLLDPAGRALDSAAFIALVQKAEREGRDMVFVIGGADGLPHCATYCDVAHRIGKRMQLICRIAL